MFSKIKRGIKWFWQRKTRGWDDREIYSLDITIAQFIIPRLKFYHDNYGGCPSGLTEEKWKEIVGKILHTFELIADEKHLPGSEDFEKYDEIMQEGLDLFRQYYFSLWW